MIVNWTQVDPTTWEFKNDTTHLNIRQLGLKADGSLKFQARANGKILGSGVTLEAAKAIAEKGDITYNDGLELPEALRRPAPSPAPQKIEETNEAMEAAPVAPSRSRRAVPLSPARVKEIADRAEKPRPTPRSPPRQRAKAGQPAPADPGVKPTEANSMAGNKAQAPATRARKAAKAVAATPAPTPTKRTGRAAPQVSEFTENGMRIKYRAKTGEIWTGRGREPRWLVPILEAAGSKRDEVLAKMLVPGYDEAQAADRAAAKAAAKAAKASKVTATADKPRGKPGRKSKADLSNGPGAVARLVSVGSSDLEGMATSEVFMIYEQAKTILRGRLD